MSTAGQLGNVATGTVDVRVCGIAGAWCVACRGPFSAGRGKTDREALRESPVTGFKLPDPGILRQELHLLDGDLVQLAQSVRLGKFLLDEEGVQVLEVRETHELRHIRVSLHARKGGDTIVPAPSIINHSGIRHKPSAINHSGVRHPASAISHQPSTIPYAACRCISLILSEGICSTSMITA